MEVELYHWAGCPSFEEAHALLRSILDEHGLDAGIVVHEVTTQEEAERLGFPGSPTIRIDGRDVDPSGAGGRAMLACRIYLLPDGRPSPIPSRDTLEAALR